MEDWTMFLFRKNKRKAHLVHLVIAFLMVASSAMTMGDSMAADAKSASVQESFTSPEAAAAALVSAAKTDDMKELLTIFGPEGKSLLFSGDEVADKNGRELFVRLYEEKNQLTNETGDKATLAIGKDGWPFPIPIVQMEGKWRFDTAEGKAELLNRRIGNNELSTIQTCLAYVDAQREYASKDRDGDGLFEYAQRFMTEPGKKNGLYWETEEGEEQSPLGPMVVNAKVEGYTKKKGDKPQPYHGYLFKILKAQGKNAPLGPLDYVIKGKMIGGFALVAYPAEYGSSGIMTFIVSHNGEVYEKDLGKATASVAQAMKTYDPDKTWTKVESKYLEPLGLPGGGS
jgi:hypothetical protein